MQCLSKEALLEMLEFIRHQTEFIIKTTSEVKDVDELLVSMSGMVPSALESHCRNEKYNIP